jgi:hypothetical protein
LALTGVRAPRAGRVSRIHTEGNLIAEDQTVILPVVTIDRLHVSFNLPGVQGSDPQDSPPTRRSA